MYIFIKCESLDEALGFQMECIFPTFVTTFGEPSPDQITALCCAENYSPRLATYAQKVKRSMGLASCLSWDAITRTLYGNEVKSLANGLPVINLAETMCSQLHKAMHILKQCFDYPLAPGNDDNLYAYCEAASAKIEEQAQKIADLENLAELAHVGSYFIAMTHGANGTEFYGPWHDEAKARKEMASHRSPSIIIKLTSPN